MSPLPSFVRSALAAFCLVSTAHGYEWKTLAGKPGGVGNADGPLATARFYAVSAAVVDAEGSVFICDFADSTIRRVSADGTVSTFAGMPGIPGNVDGTGTAARFSSPSGIAIGSDYTLYVADSGNHSIRRISPTGEVTTLAGEGTPGQSNGVGLSAKFQDPAGIAVTADNKTVYVADSGNSSIRKITLTEETDSEGIVTPARTVTLFAGLNQSEGSTDGTGISARFSYPLGLATDTGGNVFVADYGNNTIRRITPERAVTTLAGTAGTYAANDGTGPAAGFNGPFSLTRTPDGSFLVSDSGNATIRRVTPAGVVTTVAGSAGTSAITDGEGTEARFSSPTAITADSTGAAWIGDGYFLRKLSATGTVTTAAGSVPNPGFANLQGDAARFNQPAGVAIDGAGNTYVADTGNHVIRKVTPGGTTSTFAGTAGVAGYNDGAAGGARFRSPWDVALDPVSGNLYVSDYGNHCIRCIAPDGFVSTLAGRPGNSGALDGDGQAARFAFPSGLTVAATGMLYIADTGNHTIRQVTAAGTVTTVAGVAGEFGYFDGPSGTESVFRDPADVVAGSDGRLWIADDGNHVIRQVILDGEVTTFAGSGDEGSADGQGTAASFTRPTSLALMGDVLLVADSGNHTLRSITAAGVVSTIGGQPGIRGGAEGTDTAATFALPRGIAVAADGTVVVGDSMNHRIVTSGEIVNTPDLSTGLEITARSAAGTVLTLSRALPGYSYQLETSTILTDSPWAIVATATYPAEGPGTITDPAAPTADRQFYRVRIFPTPQE